MIKVVLADDHRMFTDALAVFFNEESGVLLCGSAADGTALLALLETTKPDVVLMDINMPGMNGIEATSLIRKKFPDIKVLIVTMYRTKEFMINLYNLGVHGYLLKNTGRDELLQAIKIVCEGGVYFGAEVTETLQQENVYTRANHFKELGVTFSKREKEIVRLLADGLSTQEVADTIFLSYYTVETHRKNLLNKLNLKNTAELVKYAAQLGLLD